MQALLDYIYESMTTPELKNLIEELKRYELKPNVKGWEFKKSSYKTVKKPKNEFKIAMKETDEYINGKNSDQGMYTTNIFVYLKAFDFDGINYISIVCKCLDDWDGRTYSNDFCVLNNIEGIEPFVSWCLKPHRHKTKSEIGPDGELKIWYEQMPKTYTPDIKPYVCNKKLVEKMGDLVKISCVE